MYARVQGDMTAMAVILNDCQRNVHAHRRALCRLAKLLPQRRPDAGAASDDSDYDSDSSAGSTAGVAVATLPEFCAELQGHLKRVLVVGKKAPAVDRIMDFIAQFCAEHAEVAVEMLRFAAQLHNAKDNGVRLRVCQLMERLLGDMGEDMEMDDELWEQLQQACVDRSKDKTVAVRAVAAKAMTRLQTPPEDGDAGNGSPSDAGDYGLGALGTHAAVTANDASATRGDGASDDGWSDDSDADDADEDQFTAKDGECPIIAEFKRMMATDSSATVRQAATEAICITRATLPAIVMRTRDVHKGVRAVAFKKLEAVIAPQLDVSA